MRVEGGKHCILVVFYMPTDSNSVSVIDSVYEQLKEDVLSFKQKGRVVLIGEISMLWLTLM